MSEWSVLCLVLKDGKVAPIAKTKRELSKKDMRRLCHKFRNDDDYAGEAVYSPWRVGVGPDELRSLTLIK